MTKNITNDEFESLNSEFQQEILDNFNDRIKEIELFFALIAKFESVNPVKLISVEDNISLITEADLLVHSGKDVEFTVRNILSKLNLERPDIDLINIFKSNSVLLLYNLVESTVSNTLPIKLNLYLEVLNSLKNHYLLKV